MSIVPFGTQLCNPQSEQFNAAQMQPMFEQFAKFQSFQQQMQQQQSAFQSHPTSYQTPGMSLMGPTNLASQLPGSHYGI